MVSESVAKVLIQNKNTGGKKQNVHFVFMLECLNCHYKFINHLLIDQHILHHRSDQMDEDEIVCDTWNQILTAIESNNESNKKIVLSTTLTELTVTGCTSVVYSFHTWKHHSGGKNVSPNIRIFVV